MSDRVTHPRAQARAKEIATRLHAEALRSGDRAACQALLAFVRILDTLDTERLDQVGELALYWSDLTLFSLKCRQHKNHVSPHEVRAEESAAGVLTWLGHQLMDEANQDRTPRVVLVDAVRGLWR